MARQTKDNADLAHKLIWGILAGLVAGAAFGAPGGTGTALCMAAGTVIAGMWPHPDTRQPPRGPLKFRP